MPQRPQTLAERLRSVWSHAAELTSPAGADDSTLTQHPKGNDFADRLRAAVAARH